jgi:hypothetical protein
MTFTKITIISTRISATEMPSKPSSDRVATRMSPNASSATNAMETSEISSQSTPSSPIPARNDSPNRPTSAPEAIVKSV